MRVLGLALCKATSLITSVYHGLNIQNIEVWFMTAYVRLLPLAVRLFQ